MWETSHHIRKPIIETNEWANAVLAGGQHTNLLQRRRTQLFRQRLNTLVTPSSTDREDLSLALAQSYFGIDDVLEQICGVVSLASSSVHSAAAIL